MVVFVQSSDWFWPRLSLILVPAPGMSVQSIDPAAVTRGPVVAYGHQAFLVKIAPSGIRHDFSGSAPANSTLWNFHHNLRVRPYVVGHGHNEH